MSNESKEISAKDKTADSAGVHSIIELRKMFPISARVIIRDLFRWLLLLAALCILLTILSNSFDVVERMDNQLSAIDPHTDPKAGASSVVADFGELLSTFIIGLVILISIKTIYLLAYHKRCDYFIQDHQLVLRKGIFARETFMLPVVRATQLEVERSFLDYILGIANVRVTASGVQREHSIFMPGLRYRTAMNLESYLAQELYALSK